MTEVRLLSIILPHAQPDAVCLCGAALIVTPQKRCVHIHIHIHIHAHSLLTRH